MCARRSTSASGCSATDAGWRRARGGGGGGPAGTAAAAPAAAAAPLRPDFATFAAKRLKVSGNKLVDPAGATVRLLGDQPRRAANTCAWTTTVRVFDGSTGPNSIAAMMTWNINTVRLPLNESCWLGLAGAARSAPDRVPAGDRRLRLRLHIGGSTSCSICTGRRHNGLATASRRRWPTRPTRSAFWSSVAARFKSDPMVIFDLFNEPILDDNNRQPGGATIPGAAGGTVHRHEGAGRRHAADADGGARRRREPGRDRGRPQLGAASSTAG